MAFVSPTNLGDEIVSDFKEKMSDSIEPSHMPPGYKPTLSEYMYYAKIKRNAERGGYSGNG
jgi:hypothetical protein